MLLHLEIWMNCLNRVSRVVTSSQYKISEDLMENDDQTMMTKKDENQAAETSV